MSNPNLGSQLFHPNRAAQRHLPRLILFNRRIFANPNLTGARGPTNPPAARPVFPQPGHQLYTIEPRGL